jgi:hypothetical protein
MFFYSLPQIVYYPLRFPGLDIDSRTTGEFIGSAPVGASGRQRKIRPDRSPNLKTAVFLEISRIGFPDSPAAANLHFISCF